MSKFTEHQHGRYRIKAGPLADGYAAQAFQGTRRIGERQQASDVDVAVSNARAMLDARDAQISEDRGPGGTPSSVEFADAFARLGNLPASYEAMLRAHLAAPGNRLTATQLAKAGGYENYNAANLHYGKLGQLLAEQLDFDPRRRADGTIIWTATHATWTEWPEGEQPDEGQFEWILRPEVVGALR